MNVKEIIVWAQASPRAWYAEIDGLLLSLSFVRCKSDPNVYLKLSHGSLMLFFVRG